MDLTQVLPGEILADVLRRVAPRGLAACRCACKALLAVIDDRRLLRADLLPLSLGGIFINFYCEHVSEFFARPSTGPTISGRFDYVPHAGRTDWRKIKDHCNGLVLLGNAWDWEDCYVVNPATRQWDSLPPRPSLLEEIHDDFRCEYYLVFDPMVSPDYEVFVILIPRYSGEPEDEAADPVILEEPESEWPPSLCALHVFSSKSGGWKERSFIRQGEAAGTVSGMRRHFEWCDDKRHAVHYQGALYVHCKTDFVMRICLSNDKYQVIKPPMHREPDDNHKLHLGRSEKGVYLATTTFGSEKGLYLATTTFGTPRLMVWVLEESCGHTNWVLKHNNCVTPIQDDRRPILGPWVLQDINFGEYLKECKEYNQHDKNLEWLMEMKLELNSSKKELVEEKFEWDSENDNVLQKEDEVDGRGSGYFGILGFHPYKEVVFLHQSMCRGLAYHLKDSKVQDLGYLYPTTCHLALGADRFITDSFPYTPCWTELQKATRM